jgi:predicted AlkP superfamily phosphohydrolase/phosphomutase
MQRTLGSYEYEVISTRTRGGKALWQILSEKGIPCGVLNVPMTYPPEKVAGFFVSGTFSSDPLGNFT